MNPSGEKSRASERGTGSGRGRTWMEEGKPRENPWG